MEGFKRNFKKIVLGTAATAGLFVAGQKLLEKKNESEKSPLEMLEESNRKAEKDLRKINLQDSTTQE